jgi:VIT1/CCC1 family predicted Fe2+/Mn2+ transporter
MGITKRIDEARKAFDRGEVEASRAAHTLEAIAAAREEHGGVTHKYLGEVVYGGLDGIVTTFAIVSGVAGAALGAGVILILGLANLLADGLSMATGAYLSARSEREYYEQECRREAWEVEHFPDGERAELVDLFTAGGYGEPDARQLAEIHSRDPERWVEAMMVHELGLLRDDREPLLIGLATLVAFVVAGSVPLMVYLLGLFISVAPPAAFPMSLGLSAAALFGLGAAKVLVTGRDWLRSGTEMLVVGGLAAAVAYLIGYLLRGLGG